MLTLPHASRNVRTAALALGLAWWCCLRRKRPQQADHDAKKHGGLSVLSMHGTASPGSVLLRGCSCMAPCPWLLPAAPAADRFVLRLCSSCWGSGAATSHAHTSWLASGHQTGDCQVRRRILDCRFVLGGCPTTGAVLHLTCLNAVQPRQSHKRGARRASPQLPYFCMHACSPTATQNTGSSGIATPKIASTLRPLSTSDGSAAVPVR